MTRQRGFIFTFVIMGLFIVGVAMFVLTDGSNTMLFHANGAYLRAVERDLIASGLAWASQTVSTGRDVPIGQQIDLDVAAFTCPSARLAVQFLDVQSDKMEVLITTSCQKGARTLNASRRFTVPISKTTK